MLKLFTELPLDEIGRLATLEGQEINEAKKVLATEATALLHGRDAAEEAERTARTTFETGGLATSLPTVELPQVAKKNMAYLYYPFPVKDALPAFADLVKDTPAANVDVNDLENSNVFRLLGADEVQRRAATWHRSEGELAVATQEVTRPSAPATPPAKRRKSVQRTKLWGTLLALPTAWIVGFFVSSMVIVVLLSFGRTQRDGRPVFGTRLDQLRRTVERGLPPAVPPLAEATPSRPRSSAR